MSQGSKRIGKGIGKALALGALGLLLGACTPFASKKSSLVVIVLEAFSEEDFLCPGNPEEGSLFSLHQVCHEFIRFTHAYAPSELSQPSLSSLMTASPILKHRVTQNGAVGLSSRFETLAEGALALNMRTAFFSGGVPLQDKFGLRQGFEEFNEPFGKNHGFFRPLDESIKAALAWIDGEVQKAPFFLTVYGPDLLYENRITQDGLDNERSPERRSNVEEVHESINELIGELKKRKKWKNTHFVVLGLSGPRSSLRPPNPLGRKYLHVPLQIRLSEAVRSNLGELKSEMLSFDQIGGWLQKFIRHKPGDMLLSMGEEAPLIPHQSHWMSWHGLSNWDVVGLRGKKYLFVHNPDLMVYDSFFDTKEYEALTFEESGKLRKKFDLDKKFHSFFPSKCFHLDFAQCEPQKTDQTLISQLSQLIQWTEESVDLEKVIFDFNQKGKESMKDHQVVLHWLAYRALYEKRWSHLFELGKKAQIPSWMLIAQINLREPLSFKPEACLRYFVEKSEALEGFYQHCQDSALRRVIEGLHLLKHRKRPSNRFWPQVDAIKGRRTAMNLNLRMLFINDINKPFRFEPSLSELYFFLPENHDYLDMIH